jgi:hypothetical protein
MKKEISRRGPLMVSQKRAELFCVFLREFICERLREIPFSRQKIA